MNIQCSTDGLVNWTVELSRTKDPADSDLTPIRVEVHFEDIRPVELGEAVCKTYFVRVILVCMSIASRLY